MVINIDPEIGIAYVYHYGPNYNYKTSTVSDKITLEGFRAGLQKWFTNSRASEDALYEATGGNEGAEMVQDGFDQFLE